MEVINGASVCIAEEAAHTALQVAQHYATRFQLSREDVEDCAMEFVIHLLVQKDEHTTMVTSQDVCRVDRGSLAWLRRSARNYTLNFRRAQVRRASHVLSDMEATTLTGHRGEGGPPLRLDLCDPEGALLLAELSVQLAAALALLTAPQRDVFLRYYQENESVQDIADSVGRTSAAIRQSLVGTRKRLCVLLKQRGITEGEACDYMHTLSVRRQQALGPSLPGRKGQML